MSKFVRRNLKGKMNYNDFIEYLDNLTKFRIERMNNAE